MTEPAIWVKTPRAAQILDRSKTTLMRMVKNGLLEEGVHWTKGPEPKSHIYWCPDAITATLAKTAPLPIPTRQVDA